MNWLDRPELSLLVALASGLLIGAEREQRRAQHPASSSAGLRTFGLIGLLGGLFAYQAEPLLIASGALVVGAAAIGSFLRRPKQRTQGVATELAMVVTYGIGVLSPRAPVLAASAAVVVASLLAATEPLHELVRVKLTRSELRDGLVLLLFALVLLPIAPDQQVGPFGAINPQTLVRLVILLMAVTSAGYVAQRLLGARVGLMVLGFASGFVSSTATIAAMGLRARLAGNWQSAAAGALASNVATVVLYALIIATIDLRLLGLLALPLGCAAATALGSALLLSRVSSAPAGDDGERSRAFRLWSALGFAAIVSLVGIASAALHERIGEAGIVLVSGAAALVDAHSTAGSVATLFHGGAISAHTAQLAVLTALSSNSLTKLAMAASSRHRQFALTVGGSVLLVAGSAWLGLWLS